MNPPHFLVIDTGPASGQRIPLTPDGITVGRQAGNDLVIADAQLSREHARFDLGAAGPTVTDLDSANGTTVNGRPSNGAQLLWPSDIVAFGASTARVEWLVAAAESPPTLAAPLAPGPGAVAPLRPVPSPPNAPARPNRSPLLVGAIVGVLALLCVCGGGAFAASRSTGKPTPTAPSLTGNTFPSATSIGGGQGPTATNAGAGRVPTAPGNAGGILPSATTIGAGRTPTVAGVSSGSAPTAVTGAGQAGGGGVSVGNYRCSYYGGQAVGTITSGGVHILAGNKVSYSTDGKPVAGAQQYQYTYNASSQAITFQGGPYDGKQGLYNPERRSMQIGATSCAYLP